LIRILAVRMNLVKLPRPVVTRAAEKKTQKPDHRANLPLFGPRVFLLSAYRPEGWLVGPVGIEFIRPQNACSLSRRNSP
jgi:hypothetical protein